MDFIGRKSELEMLEKEYRRDSSFVVIYGRRRVGKTTLIKEFIKDKDAIYFLATEEIEPQSMKRFSSVIARATGNSFLSNATFDDWLDLFNLVAKHRPGEKKVLVIDEFPYLVKTNPAFPSILQNAWDEILKDSNIMLILCGSFISMMKKHALSYDSPLYGRRTAQLKLNPLPFTDIYAVQSLAFPEAVEQFAVTGGIPKYIEFFYPEEDLMGQIKENVLSKSGFLYEEPNFLLKNEAMNAMNYFSIIKAISDGNHKLGKIANALGQESSAIIPYLSTLVDVGFVSKETPVTEKNPERSRRSLYFVADNFIRFWFRYVYPFKGELELDNTWIVFDEMEKDFVSKFTAFVYEDVCKDLFLKFCKDGEIEFTSSRIGSYWLNDIDNDMQIDVMAVDNSHKKLCVGECKYHEKPVDADVYFDLKKKVETSKEIEAAFPEYEVIYGIFSKSGFTMRMKDIAGENESLILVNCDEIQK